MPRFCPNRLLTDRLMHTEHKNGMLLKFCIWSKGQFTLHRQTPTNSNKHVGICLCGVNWPWHNGIYKCRLSVHILWGHCISDTLQNPMTDLLHFGILAAYGLRDWILSGLKWGLSPAAFTLKLRSWLAGWHAVVTIGLILSVWCYNWNSLRTI